MYSFEDNILNNFIARYTFYANVFNIDLKKYPLNLTLSGCFAYIMNFSKNNQNILLWKFLFNDTLFCFVLESKYNENVVIWIGFNAMWRQFRPFSSRHCLVSYEYGHFTKHFTVLFVFYLILNSPYFWK